jgi:hypothetical protein
MTFEEWVERFNQTEADPLLRAAFMDWAEDRGTLLREILRLHDALHAALWAPLTHHGSVPRSASGSLPPECETPSPPGKG